MTEPESPPLALVTVHPVMIEIVTAIARVVDLPLVVVAQITDLPAIDLAGVVVYRPERLLPLELIARHVPPSVRMIDLSHRAPERDRIGNPDWQPLPDNVFGIVVPVDPTELAWFIDCKVVRRPAERRPSSLAGYRVVPPADGAWAELARDDES